MNKRYNTQNWVGNMCQRLEAVCHEVDEFVHKDTVKYVENHMQTVGENVKKFYSGVLQDILPPLVDPAQNIAQLIPPKRINLAENYTRSVVEIKENTIGNKPENSTFVPTEKHHEPSSGLCYSDQISCAVSGYPIAEPDANNLVQQEGDSKINKTLDKAIQENFMVDESPCTDISYSKHHKDSSEEIIQIRCIDEKCDDDDDDDQSSENHLDNESFEEVGILCNTSSKIDAEVFEDADWGIENIFDYNLGIGEKIDSQPSEDVNNSPDKILFPFVEEKSEKVPIDEFGSDLNTSSELNSSITWYENNSAVKILFPFVEEKSEKVPVGEFGSDSNTSSELKSSITWDENKEEKACCIFSGGFLPAKLHDSSSEHDHSNFAPFEASVSYSKIGATDGSMVNIEDLNMHAVDLSDKKQVPTSCVIAEDINPFAFTYGSRRGKSYKKIIQDAFMSRKKLTKEYKQLAIWYGDIEKELSESMGENSSASNTGNTQKSSARDLCDSEWEIL